MPVTSIAGSAFTVTVGATAYTGQVKSGTVNSTPNVLVEKTLGPNKATTQTDVVEDVSADFLYDEESGFYMALWTASRTGAALAVVIVGGGGDWTGSLTVTALSASFDAESSASCSASLTGTLVFAAV